MILSGASLAERLDFVLPNVEKPSRYTGGEWNSVTKDWDEVEVTFALAFPDVYDVGMGHLGYKILYSILNREEDIAAERVYAPWIDMEEQMRRAGIPLYSLESKHALSEFDIVGFTLQYELSYTNILNMLDLGGIPLHSSERGERDPLVIAGGPCVYNPEPLAPFIDFFYLGDAENTVVTIARTVKQWKSAGGKSRKDLLKLAAQIPGVYVPSFYRAHYTPEGFFAGLEPIEEGVPKTIRRQVVQDLDAAPFPDKFVVPFLDVVHDRVMVEVARGCTRGCRFCQAGMIYRPVRERSPQILQRQVRTLIGSTGYEEVSLTSLSTGDYTHIADLIPCLMDDLEGTGVALSLPSLRVDSFSVNLADQIQKARKTGLTFAPEAGTQRLRNVINKNVTEEDLMAAAGAAFSSGWDQLKLYFMIGLPTETDEDVLGIAELANRVLQLGREIRGREKKAGRVKVHVSVSSFVPKSHTPFQWEAQDTVAELLRKQDLLRRALKDRGIKFSWHDVRVSYLESVFARGDRRVAKALEAAFRRGCKFDSWSDCFAYDTWMDAFAEVGVDPDFHGPRERGEDEALPWDFVDIGVSRQFLLRERHRARKGITTLDCRFTDCSGCGLCPAFHVHNQLAEVDNDARN